MRAVPHRSPVTAPALPLRPPHPQPHPLQPELSLYSGREERIYEMGSDLHKELRKQIKKMTAEPAVLPGSP